MAKKPVKKITKKKPVVKGKKKPVKKIIKKKVTPRSKKASMAVAATVASMSTAARDITDIVKAVTVPVSVAVSGLVSKVNPADFPFSWAHSCGNCGAKVPKDDPNGKNFLYRLVCPECHKAGCDECMPEGRGCLCPECKEKPHNKYNEDLPDLT